MRDRIAIVGAGSIGGAWAVVFARAGMLVSVYDIDPARIDAAPGEIRGRIESLRDHHLVPPVDEIADRISYGTDLTTAVGDATYVQECVLESVDVKRQVFAALDAATATDTVLASSTSMIVASRFAADLAGRDRCVVVHPGNPPYLLPVAEVVPAPFTSAETVRRTNHLLISVGMTPIAVNAEVEGFVFNRLQGALLREAYCLVRDGVVSALDVDRIVRLGLGRRWGVIGPFATSDLNTRGGIERHATLMGPAYARMGAERGQDDPWTPKLVAGVADELHAVQPLDEWDENVRRRDEALIRQVAAADAPTGTGDRRPLD
ncbi:MAG: 3-hydroxyacyl-CoA dehydrogenase [Nakamurella sp.]